MTKWWTAFRRGGALRPVKALVLAGATAMTITTCQSPPKPQPSALPVATSTTPELDTLGWRTQNDPHGFTVKTPARWTIAVPDAHTAVMTDEADHALVIVRPFLAAASASADQCVRSTPMSIKPLVPNAAVAGVVDLPGTPQEAEGTLHFGGDSGSSPSTAGVLCAVNGNSGMLYGIASPSSSFSRLRPTLVAASGTASPLPTSCATAGQTPSSASRTRSTRTPARSTRWPPARTTSGRAQLGRSSGPTPVNRRTSTSPSSTNSRSTADGFGQLSVESLSR